MQAAHQAQRRVGPETVTVAMEDYTRAVPAGQITLLLVGLGLDIFLMIPALDEPVAVVVAVACLAIVLLTQKPRVAVYRMAEKEEHKTERIPGLPAVPRVVVAAALVVLTATVALAAGGKCISASIFKGVRLWTIVL